MEENKINMPQPPKELRKMPPPPPPRPNVNDISKQNEHSGENVLASSSLPERPINNSGENNTDRTVTNVESVATAGAVKTEVAEVDEVGHETKNVAKRSGGIKTALYWLGFVVALAGMAFLIYMLVK